MDLGSTGIIDPPSILFYSSYMSLRYPSYSAVKQSCSQMLLSYVGHVRSQADAQKIKKDLDDHMTWSKKWLLKFNILKCKIMHCSKTNPRLTYRHLT